MNIYHTETEQLEIIRQWLKKYGNRIFSIVIAILLVVSACHWWQNHQLKIKADASNRYQQLMQAVADDDSTLIDAQATDLMEHYDATVYAQGAALVKAKEAVNLQQWPQALKALEFTINHSNSTALQQIARLRSARILLIQKQFDKALSMLETIDNKAYLPSIEEIQGDIYIAQNNQEKAIIAYKKAQKGFKKAGISHSMLSMKLNALK